MNGDDWDAIFTNTRLHLQNDRGINPREAWRRARLLTEKHHGPRPEEVKLPLKVRLALWWLERKVEDKMDGKKSSVPKWILAIVFGLASAYGVFELAMADGAISVKEGFAIGNAILVAAFGKFSNPEKKISHLPSLR